MARPAFMPQIKKTEAAATAPVVEQPVAPAAPAAPAAPVSPTATTAPVVEQPVAATAPVAPAAPKKERKKPNRQMTPEDTEFIVANVKTMSYTEIAEARGITKHQVNRVLMQVKKQLREAAADENSLATVEAYITENLSRPEDTRPGGGGGRASVVKSSIEDIVGNILNSIG